MKKQFAVLALSIAACSVSLAGESSKCDPKDFLEVAGPLSNKTAKNRLFVFREDEVLKLPSTKITTSTEWSPKSEYIGPYLREVLRAAGAPSNPHSIRVYATDNYEIDIPITDLQRYKPILAYSRDGARLKLGTLGPLFLVYPRDTDPELMKVTGQAKFVWMVCRIEVE